jgi:RNAse (barnase) inhibitor barstar
MVDPGPQRSALDRILGHAATPGVYDLPAGLGPADVEAEAQQHGWNLFRLDCVGVRDKAGFADVCSRVFRFPDWFAANFDSFYDLLEDKFYLPSPGCVLLWENAGEFESAAPDDVRQIVEVLEAACRDDDERRRTPLIVLRAGSLSE